MAINLKGNDTSTYADSITAAGSVSAGGGIADATGSEMGSGYAYVRNDGDNNFAFGVLNGGNTSTDFSFLVTGGGSVKIGGAPTTDPNIELNATLGSITAASNITATSFNGKGIFQSDVTRDTSGCFIATRTDTNTEVFRVEGSGNGVFTGTVTASNITAFKAALTSAVTASTDHDTLKAAILSALASL